MPQWEFDPRVETSPTVTSWPADTLRRDHLRMLRKVDQNLFADGQRQLSLN